MLRGSRTFFIPALLAVLFLALPLSSADASFSNPVVPQAGDADSPDPWIFTRGGRYYITHTSGDHVELRKSRSLSGLASASPRIVWDAADGPAAACCDVWAPEFHRLRGPDGERRWYLYYTAGPGDITQQRLHVLKGRRHDPFGPYRYLSEIDVGDRYAIDANVFRAHRKDFILFSGAPADVFTPTSLFIAELAGPATPASAPVEISRPTLPWETIPFPINEGPEALLHGRWLHVIFSASWCGTSAYSLGRLTVPRGADLLDPATWRSAKQPSPVFESSSTAGVYGPGHGSFFTSPDGSESWMTYHASDNRQGCFTGGLRLTHAKPFTWNRDGTPDFGTPPPLARGLPRPGGDPSRTLQAESRMKLADRADAEVVVDRHLVGGSGLEVPGPADGPLGSFRLTAPRHKLAIGIRVRLGEAPITIRLRSGGRRLGTETAEGAAGTTHELRFRPARLGKGHRRIAVDLASTATATIDQLRATRLR